MTKKIIIILITILSVNNLKSQPIIDHVVAIVGNEIILKSDVENQYIQIISQGQYNDDGDLKCDILEELLFQKMLVVKAEQDSLEITDKEVNQELDRRLNVFTNQLGSEKAVEDFYGKSLNEIKNDFRKIIKDQLLAQKAQSDITKNVKVTPSEVKKYFESIPNDSLPVVPAYIEVSEIEFAPEIDKKDKEKTIAKLNEIKDRILNGESFATMAVLYSEDPGSASNGGELGFVSRTDLVPEFASVGFNLKNTTEISRVVETEYGFHIIQLIEKRGNMMNFRHILMTPQVSIEKIIVAEKRADSVYNILFSDTAKFENIAKKYSSSDNRLNGGKVYNPYSGSTKLSIESLDPATKKAIANLKPGELSKPFLSTSKKGGKVIKIVRLDNKSDSHVVNLKDDYYEIQQYAIQKENQKVIEKWINNMLNNIFINIDDSYKNCEFKFADWNKK